MLLFCLPLNYRIDLQIEALGTLLILNLKFVLGRFLIRLLVFWLVGFHLVFFLLIGGFPLVLTHLSLYLLVDRVLIVVDVLDVLRKLLVLVVKELFFYVFQVEVVLDQQLAVESLYFAENDALFDHQLILQVLHSLQQLLVLLHPLA